MIMCACIWYLIGSREEKEKEGSEQAVTARRGRSDAGSNNDRVRARPTLLPELRRRLAAYSTEHLSEVFERNGLPYAPIVRPEQLFDDPHLNATGGLAEITLTDGERAGQTARTTLLPIRMDGQRPGIRHNPPTLGEHTRQLLESLGYGLDEVTSMEAAGAVV